MMEQSGVFASIGRFSRIEQHVWSLVLPKSEVFNLPDLPLGDVAIIQTVPHSWILFQVPSIANIVSSTQTISQMDNKCIQLVLSQLLLSQ